ncbi:tetratricopeptide repeat protein [Candidatus Riflebacteria bacterium]
MFCLFIFISVVAVGFAYLKRRDIPFSFFIFAYIFSILPVSGFLKIPYHMRAFVADRYSYFAMIFPILGFLLLLKKVVASIENKRIFQIIPLVFILIFLLPYASISYQACFNWKDGESIWKNLPAGNNYRAYYLFKQADFFVQKGKPGKAIERLKEALQFQPQNLRIQHYLGFLQLKKNDLKEAKKIFLKLIQQKPQWSVPHNNLGLIYGMQGEFAKAIWHLENALKLSPGYSEASQNLNHYYEKINKSFDGQQKLELAKGIVAQFPSSVAGRNLYAIALKNKGLLEEAKQQFLKNLKLKPGDYISNCYLGIIYTDAGGKMLEKAVEHFKIAILTKPEDGILAYYNLGVAYGKQGQYREAGQAFEKVKKLNPQFQKAQQYLEFIEQKMQK